MVSHDLPRSMVIKQIRFNQQDLHSIPEIERVMEHCCQMLVSKLETLGYVYTRWLICSDPFEFGPTPVWIRSVNTGPVLNWNGTVPHRITFISGPIWYQIADPIRTGSTKSHVNTKLICTNFVPVPNKSGPV